MPDWTYRTLFRPPLFALPFRTARALAFSGLGTLAKFPGGTLVVDFFGHMLPPRDLTVTVDGVEYRSPVGLGPQLDPQQQALAALSRFGVGWLEIDPVFAGIDAVTLAQLSLADERLHWPPAKRRSESQGSLPPSPALPIPIWLRLSCDPSADRAGATATCLQVIESFGAGAQAYTLNTLALAVEDDWSVKNWREHVARVLHELDRRSSSLPLYVVVPVKGSIAELHGFLVAALGEGVSGFVIANVDQSARESAQQQGQNCCERITALRQSFDNDITLVAAAGIHSPADAIEAWRAGATLVQVDTGLIFAGPGLPKRINEARRFYQAKSQLKTPHPNPLPGVPRRGSTEISCPPALPSHTAARAVEQAWFWLLLLGLSMGGGGLIAWAIAATRVVLPYDEAYLEMTREQIAAINPRLLLFMAHDRITLAGTMLAIGVFYSFLAWHGVRRGAHWAWLTILASALSGFASFFLFLFFGYFDPFHALVTAILFQLLLAGWQGKLDEPAVPQFPNLSDTLAWRMCQWGQLLFVAQGIGLIVGGCVICYVGSTTVFVHEDLEFMRTTREGLLGLHPRLIPVVAHDRASFGGMLIANGLAILLSALWGFRQGDGWQWWMYLLAATVAYGSTMLVHLSVGYTSLMHLTPAVVGFGGVIVALILSYPYLMGLDVEHYKRWRALLH